MTKRERVAAAIHFEQTDCVPHNITFVGAQRQKMIDYTGDPEFESEFGNHILSGYTGKPPIEVRPGYFQDEFGVIWNRSGPDKDIGVVVNELIGSEEDLESYTFPPVDVEYLRTEAQRLSTDPLDRFRMMRIDFSLFERAWTLVGMENLLCAMVTEPEFVHRLLQKICDHNLAVLDAVLPYDFECVYCGDDWGQQRGLIMGPNCWRTFIKPYLGQMYAKVHAAGKFVAQHSCGDIREVVDDLYELGLDLYQNFQPEIYGLDYAKKLYGRIAIWGGISTQADLPTGTPEEICRITRATMAAFSAGGLVVAPTHDIPFDVPPENVLAMLKAFGDPEISV